MSVWDQSYLPTLTGFLRMGICVDTVPGYDPAAWRRALGVVLASCPPLPGGQPGEPDASHPTERAVLALLATHGTEGVEERWGGRRPERLVIEARRREARAGLQPAR